MNPSGEWRNTSECLGDSGGSVAAVQHTLTEVAQDSGREDEKEEGRGVLMG